MGADNLLAQIILTVIVILFAIPGLVFEPGPLSEITAIAALGGIWGLPALEEFA